MLYKKIILISILIGISIFNSACTGKLLSEKHIEKKIINSYDENITNFLVTENNEKIIFIGEKYHYIFDYNKDFKTLIDNKNNIKIDFHVNEKTFVVNNITNKINIRFVPEIIYEEKDKELIQNISKNFTLSRTYSQNSKKVVINLEGERYLTTKEINDKIQSKLEKISSPISLKIQEEIEERNNFILAKKITLTPITIVGDTVAVVAGTGLLIVVFELSEIFKILTFSK